MQKLNVSGLEGGPSSRVFLWQHNSAHTYVRTGIHACTHARGAHATHVRVRRTHECRYECMHACARVHTRNPAPTGPQSARTHQWMCMRHTSQWTDDPTWPPRMSQGTILKVPQCQIPEAAGPGRPHTQPQPHKVWRQRQQQGNAAKPKPLGFQLLQVMHAERGRWGAGGHAAHVWQPDLHERNTQVPKRDPHFCRSVIDFSSMCAGHPTPQQTARNEQLVRAPMTCHPKTC